MRLVVERLCPSGSNNISNDETQDIASLQPPYTFFSMLLRSALWNTSILLALSFSSCAQGKKHSRLGLEVAKEELQEALKKPPESASPIMQQPLPDSIAAVRFAEPILFRTYGKKPIVDERPYEIYLIDKYWVLMGTLPENWDGGTFTIILDSRDSRVIELTHGK